MKLSKQQQDLIREGVRVTNLADLRRVLRPFMPNTERGDDTISLDVSKINKVDHSDDSIASHGTIVAKLGDQSKRKLLIQGLDMIERQRVLFREQDTIVDDEDYGGFMPVSLTRCEGYSWVDTMISRCLDGRRRPDNTIEWVLPDGLYVFEPRSGKLTKEEDDGSPGS